MGEKSLAPYQEGSKLAVRYCLLVLPGWGKEWKVSWFHFLRSKLEGERNCLILFQDLFQAVRKMAQAQQGINLVLPQERNMLDLVLRSFVLEHVWMERSWVQEESS